jgi:hypothetical protein
MAPAVDALVRRERDVPNLKTRRRKLTLAELVNEPWVQLPGDSLFGSMAVEVFRTKGHEPPWPTVVTHSEYLKNDL